MLYAHFVTAVQTVQYEMKELYIVCNKYSHCLLDKFFDNVIPREQSNRPKDMLTGYVSAQ